MIKKIIVTVGYLFFGLCLVAIYLSLQDLKVIRKCEASGRQWIERADGSGTCVAKQKQYA